MLARDALRNFTTTLIYEFRTCYFFFSLEDMNKCLQIGHQEQTKESSACGSRWVSDEFTWGC